MGMNKDLLVEIFVDVGDAAGDGYIATGYPVANNRIITAHHALYPEGKIPKSIEVRWHHQSGELKNWQPAQVID